MKQYKKRAIPTKKGDHLTGNHRDSAYTPTAVGRSEFKPLI